MPKISPNENIPILNNPEEAVAKAQEYYRNIFKARFFWFSCFCAYGFRFDSNVLFFHFFCVAQKFSERFYLFSQHAHFTFEGVNSGFSSLL